MTLHKQNDFRTLDERGTLMPQVSRRSPRGKDLLIFLFVGFFGIICFISGMHYGMAHPYLQEKSEVNLCDGCELGDGFWGVGADAPDPSELSCEDGELVLLKTDPYTDGLGRFCRVN